MPTITRALRKYFPRLLLLAAWLVAISASQQGYSAEPARRPNVLVILTDDQRWDAISAHEQPFLGLKTPHIDRLATEGVRFRNAFCTTSLCSPSRACYLSGLYAHAHGVVNNFTEFPADLPSYPSQLRALGYETAYLGKWHMGEDNDAPRPGFDYWVSHKGQGKYFNTTFNIDGRVAPTEGYYTHTVTDLAVAWLERERTKPFVMILGHKAPHGPFEPEEKYAHSFDAAPVAYPASAFQLADKPRWFTERLDTWHGIYGSLYGYRQNIPDRSPAGVEPFARFVRSYAGVIRSVDDSVGRLYSTLAKLGQLDNTIVVFCGDNGFLMGEHGMIDKRTMHEESIRVPMLVRYPAAIKPGTVIDEQVLNIDLAPSLLELCGAPALPKTHGRSWKQLVAGDKTGWRTAWFYEYNYEQQFPYTPNVRGIRTAEWKYIHAPHGDGSADRHLAELYNLRDDPLETKNLIASPSAAAQLSALQADLARLMQAADALPDRMPIDAGIKTELPEKSIR